ncbi:hypothetical protein PG994_012669 [Apiospora phragmitis]|uniref:SET domain-containing protein n=1 Tax=Apiospora phragmitis TaxID=2905665 RepID=A0ABR1TB38_9PEZI
MPPQHHPYESLPVPSDAPFTLKPSGPGKGWGAFATRSIERGTVILRETAVFAIPKHQADITELDVRAAFRKAPPAAQRQFLALRDNAAGPFRSMAKAFAENSFAIGASVERRGAHGFFPLLSRFNHSCVPNAAVPILHDAPKDSPAIYATRDIAAGEEIMFRYDPHFECRTAIEHHEALDFVCDCPACRPGTEFQRASDLRRRLIRGLQFLVSGEGPAASQGGSTSASANIIPDPGVRKEVAEFRTPLSAQLIYNLLTVCLMEAEGILDEFEVGRLQPGFTAMATMFRRPRNASIARRAMAQSTPTERLRVAFALYGRADEADEEMARVLRAMQGVSLAG